MGIDRAGPPPDELAGDDAPQRVDGTVELLRRVRSGDAAALDDLMNRNLAALCRWATGRLPRGARDLNDTVDIVQETVLSVLPVLDRFDARGEGALLAYLRQALLNRIRNEARRVKRMPDRVEVDTRIQTPERSPLDGAELNQSLERYDAAMQGLSEEDRAAVMMRLELHYSYKEIADALGKPTPDAARMAVSRAIVRLTEAMEAPHG